MSGYYMTVAPVDGLYRTCVSTRQVGALLWWDESKGYRPSLSRSVAYAQRLYRRYTKHCPGVCGPVVALREIDYDVFDMLTNTKGLLSQQTLLAEKGIPL